ncbi:MAG: hypothetical protein AAF234_11455 [Pseudomonadota bacterium]
MTKTDVTAQSNEEDIPQSRDYPALEIDYDLYMKMLEDSEWNDDQKREFIETMWSIIVSFVDLGFGNHPVQQANGDVDIPKEFLSLNDSGMVESTQSPKNQFLDAAGDDTSPASAPVLERSSNDRRS